MVANTEELVVVGIDGSAESLAALRWALKEGVRLEIPVEVVHCYLPQTLTDFGFSTPHELHTGSAIMVDNEVEAALKDMSQQPEVRRCSLAGSPAKVLLERAKTASLLVLGVHGKTVLRDLILGKVARTCLRQSPCPVVVVGLDESAVRHETPSPVAAAKG
ncbi:MAG: universal stress protein [Actinomycetota bacterium]|nr:universal stress protein [Actinomycetota bacterium]